MLLGCLSLLHAAAQHAAVHTAARTAARTASASASHTSQEQGHFPFEGYLKRLQTFEAGKAHPGDAASSVSGIGSHLSRLKPFVSWFERWLRDHSVESLVEASCGHWPSGWQPSVRWPPLAYTGIDIMDEMVEANREFFKTRNASSQGTFGLSSHHFQSSDLVAKVLPRADVLLTKDTIMHIPNNAIQSFLRRSVTVCPPRFKHVIFVGGYEAGGVNADTTPQTTYHNLDMAKPPFGLNVSLALRFAGSKADHRLSRVVQVYDTARNCVM